MPCSSETRAAACLLMLMVLLDLPPATSAATYSPANCSSRCHGHTQRCDSDGICRGCSGNTAGTSCELCVPGFYRVTAGDRETDCEGELAIQPHCLHHSPTTYVVGPTMLSRVRLSPSADGRGDYSWLDLPLPTHNGEHCCTLPQHAEWIARSSTDQFEYRVEALYKLSWVGVGVLPLWKRWNRDVEIVNGVQSNNCQNLNRAFSISPKPSSLTCM